MTAEELITLITEAFDGVQREDGVTLHEADVIDDYGTTEQRAAARELDSDTRWQDVPQDDIRCFSWIWSFLDSKGFRYYLPACLCFAVKNYDSPDTDSPSTIIDQLDPNHLYGSFYDAHVEIYSLLSRKEREAVCAFIRYMADAHGEYADPNVLEFWEFFVEGEVLPSWIKPGKVHYLQP